MDDKNENLKNLATFFQKDLAIKKLLAHNAPNYAYQLDFDALICYKKQWEELFDILEKDFLNLGHILKLSSEDLKYIEGMFTRYKQILMKLPYEFKSLAEFYQNTLTDMSVSLYYETKTNIVGYLCFRESLIRKCQTANELLHVMHSMIMNDETFYLNLPKIAEKTNEESGVITLYGARAIHPVAKEVYEKFPLDVPTAFADIVSVHTEKAMMMVRDLGHALTIEITNKGESCQIEYFVPKICDIEMINALRGVRKVDENSKFAVGSYETNLEEAAGSILELLRMVPDDTYIMNRTENELSSKGL